MSKVRVFKSTIPNCNFVAPDGFFCHFLSGEFLTDNPKYIEVLETEVAAKHPHFYIDPNDKERSTERVDYLDEIRRKAVEDYKKSIAVAMDGDRDGGTTTNTGHVTNMGNTKSIAEAAAGSTGDAAATAGANSANVGTGNTGTTTTMAPAGLAALAALRAQAGSK